MASLSATILSISAFGIRRSSSPKATFSATVRHGSRANCWNTMAMRLVRSILSSVGAAMGDVDRAAAVIDQNLARARPC